MVRDVPDFIFRIRDKGTCPWKRLKFFRDKRISFLSIFSQSRDKGQGTLKISIFQNSGTKGHPFSRKIWRFFAFFLHIFKKISKIKKSTEYEATKNNYLQKPRGKWFSVPSFFAFKFDFQPKNLLFADVKIWNSASVTIKIVKNVHFNIKMSLICPWPEN